MKRVAFVIQRYGAGITGGSESLAQAVAERLVARGHGVSVFTTCARDYVTWRNALPAGTSTEGGVGVFRYPVTEERDLAAFNAFAEPLYARQTTRAEELEFLRRQGPVSPGLSAALAERRDDFDAILFFTYLYGTTWHGLQAAPARSILVPTTHDEPPLRFSIFDELFGAARAFAFLTPPEQALVERRFGVRGRPHAVTGIGVEPAADLDVDGFRIRHDVLRPWALYAGRIDAGKGCAEMLAHFERYRRDVRGGADLLLIGNLAMDEPRQPGVRYLGFLPEKEKAAALAGARAVVCPSPYESLSITLLEGLALGTPALANALSPVLKDHCLRSQGGLFYESADEFAEALDLLERREDVRAALGRNGRRYVDAEYRWERVLKRWERVIDAVAG